MLSLQALVTRLTSRTDTTNIKLQQLTAEVQHLRVEVQQLKTVVQNDEEMHGFYLDLDLFYFHYDPNSPNHRAMVILIFLVLLAFKL